MLTNHLTGPVSHTCKSAGVPERSYGGICQACEQRDDCVHQIAVIENAALGLLDKNFSKLTKVSLELLPIESWFDKRIVFIVLHEAENSSGLQKRST